METTAAAVGAVVPALHRIWKASLANGVESTRPGTDVRGARASSAGR